MNSVLIQMILNLVFLPIYNLLLLSSLPSGLLTEYRILGISGWLGFNLFLTKQLKYEWKKPVILQALLIPIALLGLYYIHLRFTLQPYGGSWDTYGMWYVKTRDYVETFLRGEEFVLIHFDWIQPNYPIFFPLFVSFFQILSGEWLDEIPFLYHYFLYLLSFLPIYLILQDRKPTLFSAYLILTHGLLLPILVSASNQILDFSVATFAGLGVFFLFQIESGKWDQNWKSFFFLALSFVLVLNTKEEGLIYSILLLGFLLLFSKLNRVSYSWKVSLPTFILFFFLLVLYKISAPIAMQFSLVPELLKKFILDPERYKLVFNLYLYHQKNVLYADAIIPAILLLLYRKNLKYLLIPLGASFAFFFILIITIYNQQWHIETAQGRLQTGVLQVMILTALMIHFSSLEAEEGK